MLFGGYTGKVLWVNLTDKTTSIESIYKEEYRKYIGGYGLGARMSYEKMK
ncbi:MAG: aldehyde ferredoxin oxidoreductase N-terminal domain-containing protein [Bacillota bacterium]|nr:aldehyde ferredoxin oxidoreductase N-terminal domain-containing protein [Bacillota bacterium]